MMPTCLTIDSLIDKRVYHILRQLSKWWDMMPICLTIDSLIDKRVYPKLRQISKWWDMMPICLIIDSLIQLILYKMYTHSMVTIYLSLREQVAVSTFFMKSLVDKQVYHKFRQLSKWWDIMPICLTIDSLIQLISYKRYTHSMVTIYLFLREQVAVGIFFMKSWYHAIQ